MSEPGKPIPTATFMVLHGGVWGVSVAPPVRIGQVVTVTRRDGETRQVTISGIVGRSLSGNRLFCRIEESGQKKTPRKRQPEVSPGRITASKHEIVDDGTIPFDGPYKIIK